jgi:hypothetical protein
MRSSVPASSYVQRNERSISQQEVLRQPHKESTCLVQTSQHMRQIHDRVPVLVHLMENIIPEKLHDVPVPRFRPPRFPGKSSHLRTSALTPPEARKRTRHPLRSLVNKPKFAQQPHQTAILQLAHQFSLQPINRTNPLRQHSRRKATRGNIPLTLATHPSPPGASPEPYQRSATHSTKRLSAQRIYAGTSRLLQAKGKTHLHRPMLACQEQRQTLQLR